MTLKKHLIVLTGMLFCLYSGLLCAQQTPGPDSITVRTIPSQTVLYTVVRGSYDKLGEAFGRLYALAGANAIKPVGAAWSVHLNNPKITPPEHWLTEIRIPVDDTAKKLTGTLGPMTDVKITSEMTAVTGIKHKGTVDSSEIFKQVYLWALQNGYSPVDASMQRIISDTEDHDYSQMEVEILVPVAKCP